MRRLTKFPPKKPIPFLRNFTQIPSSHQEPTPLSSPNPQVALLNLCNNISTLKITHSILLVHNLTNDTHTQTKLLSKYASFGNINSARLIFNQIQYPDLFSFRIMIRWYFLNDMYEELILFYRYLRKCLNETDNIVFSIVLKACKELRDVDEGKKVHGVIVKVGSPDGFVLTGLEDLYAKCGEIEYARVLFDESPERNVVSWSSMISGYVQNDFPEEGLVLFNQMREDFVEPNEVTLGSLLTACTKMGALHQGRWIHGFMIKTAIIVNSFVASTLLDMYVKRGRTVDEARALFDELKGFELVPWTTMIVGYTHRNKPYEALKLFADKRWAHVLPNSVTIANVLSACAVVGDLNLGRNIHCIGKKLGLEDSPVENALVHMYAKCGMIRDASYIFEMIEEKDVVAWNSMISGYFQNGFTQEGVALFRKMRQSYTLDAVTLVSVLSAYTTLGVLWAGSAVHAYALQLGFLSSNVYVGTALLNFYSKCGDWESARRVFDEIKEKSNVTWCSMMAGCGMHGDSSGSIALLGEMMKEKLEPNEVIFTTILSACSHSGNIGEGWKYFNSMCKEHRLVPSMKHYVCMIDLLARAGRLEEAFDFIERMPIEPDTRIWGALLHGCQLHSRLDLVEVAVRKMIELQPDTASYYVLMSNLYASDGRWEQVNEMRELMKKQGLSKIPGCSELEMDMNDDFPALAESACG